MDGDKKKIIEIAESLQSEIWKLAWKIGNNPERGHEEYYASELLTGYLANLGFQIQKPLSGMETSFLAVYHGQLPGPKLGFFAEYDALPGVGHGCGHHLIGAASTGAAAVLSLMPELRGSLVVIGSPAEETSGAKVNLVQAGVINDLDLALMFHPGSCNVVEISSLALDAIEVSYIGKATHMAMVDNDGINALDALIDLFQRLKRLKQSLARDERIDGIITYGGSTPNIVPDLAVARFYLRAGKRKDLNALREKFLDCAREAGKQVQADMVWKYFENSYDEMKSNRVLAKYFIKNLNYLGIRDIESPQAIYGSVDMGNVSQVIPAIHPFLQLGTGLEAQHSSAFTEAALSSAGEEVLALAVKALSLTGWDVLTDSKKMRRIREEFEMNSFPKNVSEG
ncbi:MAG: amidohydrolase [Desulfitobacteriia bacterium]|jgi:amidohydrolase